MGERMKRILISFLIIIISVTIFADECLNIEAINGSDYIITLNSGNYSIAEKVDNSGEYTEILTENNFEQSNGTGLPILPNRVFTLNGKFEVEFVRAEYDTIDNVSIRPGNRPLMIGPDFYDKQEELIYSEVYDANEYWPQNGVISQKYGIFRSVPVTTINITPFKYNPITKTLLAAKELTLKLKGEGVEFRSNALKNPLVSNILVKKDRNRVQPSNIEESGRAGKIVVFTIDSLLPAVEKLVRWQKLKGYDVVLESQAGQYPKSEVIAKINSELTQSDAVSKYMLMFGNTKAVEEYEVKWYYFNNLGNVQGVSMSRYGDTEGDDHLPEIARGIVPANNMREAEICVSKFLNYEINPPTDAAFYDNILGAAQSGFSHKPVDKIMDYMSDKGYTTTPRYYFNDDQLAMVDRMSNGVIIAAQYDHGYRGGWATPEFTGDQINTMTNGDMLPYMFSINCLSGSFDYANGMDKWNPKATYEPDFYGLTERFLFKENGGGVGAFGATNITYTGYNDTLLFGLFKAVWPEDNSSTPIYRVGDMADFALYQIHEKYGIPDEHSGTQSIPNLCDYHFMLYHNMCDPTLNIRTKVPTTVFAEFNPKSIAADATSFSGTNISIDEGTAVVYHEKNKKVIGRAKISGGSFNMTLDNSILSKDDSVTIALNGVNCVPYIKTIKIGEEVSINKPLLKKSSNLFIKSNSFEIVNNNTYPITMELWNIQGKKILSKKINAEKKTLFNKKNLDIAAGTFLIKLIDRNSVSTNKILFTNY